MNTSLDCMPCFMKMVLREARLACPDDEDMHRRIVVAWGEEIGALDLNQSPPVIARHLSNLVKSMTGCGDLYREDKIQSNARVLELFPELKSMIDICRSSEQGDPFALALELAIIGNFIDRGVDLKFDWEAEIENVTGTISQHMLKQFMELAGSSSKVLILGDNTGEIVLDMLLVEELKLRGCEVTYAVRSKPILNDATMEDAIEVGMTRLCQVVESGVDTPGTIIESCTPKFLELMQDADLILSKGQGNFEALEGVLPGVFCAFKVKCDRVARKTGLALGKSAFCRTHLSAENIITSPEAVTRDA